MISSNALKSLFDFLLITAPHHVVIGISLNLIIYGVNYMDRISKFLLCSTITAMSVIFTSLPSIAQAEGYKDNRAIVFVVRHAEKERVKDERDEEPGVYDDNCNDGRTRCEEELSPLGWKRAEFFAEWAERRGIAQDITHLYSSDKQRTRQTLKPLADIVLEKYNGNLPDSDYDQQGGEYDGISQLPFRGDKDNEVEDNSDSVDPMVAALRGLRMGDVAFLAGHSGKIYEVFGGENEDGSGGLGIDTTIDDISFPREGGKVEGFDNVWKIAIRKNGNASLRWHKKLQFNRLKVAN